LTQAAARLLRDGDHSDSNSLRKIKKIATRIENCRKRVSDKYSADARRKSHMDYIRRARAHSLGQAGEGVELSVERGTVLGLVSGAAQQLSTSRESNPKIKIISSPPPSLSFHFLVST
jgi:coproporphyrinogen III oxidase